MEKKRWMLSALQNMDPPPVMGAKPTPPNQKILAFFETQGKDKPSLMVRILLTAT